MTSPSRSGTFWWLYVAVLAGAALFIGHTFVGILVVGLFGYYATRPICTSIESVVESDQRAAALTVLAVLVPVLGLALYTVIRIVQQIRQVLDESVVSMLVSRIFGLDAVPTIGDLSPGALLRNPPSIDRLTDLLFGSVVQQGARAIDVIFGTLVLVSLAVTLSYALLAYDEPISDGFATLVDGRDTTVYSYALAVDTDLESIFFGNLLFVLVMSVVATVTYAATNLVASPEMQIPMVFVLGALTGLASLIPIVVGKVVYLPVIAYLGVRAAQQGGGGLVFVAVVLVVYVLVLDILPQSFVQPYLSGRQLNPMLLLFAYILGPIMFGWYGFFLLPIVFVLMLETVRIVLPELLHGEPIVSEPELTEEIGASSDEMHEDVQDESAPAENGSDKA